MSTASTPDTDALESWVLVKRAQNGDSSAVAELYERYHGHVVKYAHYRTGNQVLAEDIAQTAWVRALGRLNNWSFQGKDFKAWLFTITRNLIIDYYKSHEYRRMLPVADILGLDQEDADRAIQPEHAVADHITSHTLAKALRTLNHEQQQCVLMRYVLGYSIVETAQVMDKNVGAIKALAYRGVRNLAQALPEGFHQP